GKSVVYRATPTANELSSDGFTEMINANICVQNYLVTGAGGLYYTGSTCEQGNMGGGGGGGYFRYVKPDNGGVIEIARDWWNFIYDTAVDAENNDSAVFFGPSPRSATTASWDSAC